MATREGIYVGGYEIVQRYVGNRLVWEKNKYILLGTNNDGNWNSVGSTEAKRYSTNKRPELYNKETLERVVMIKVENETFSHQKLHQRNVAHILITMRVGLLEWIITMMK